MNSTTVRLWVTTHDGVPTLLAARGIPVSATHPTSPLGSPRSTIAAEPVGADGAARPAQHAPGSVMKTDINADIGLEPVMEIHGEPRAGRDGDSVHLAPVAEVYLVGVNDLGWVVYEAMPGR